MITLREIIRELFYDKTRTILTILAIAWGTFSIAATLAIGEGLRLNFERTMANAGDKLLAIRPGMTSKNYQGMRANEPLKLNKKDAKAIAALPNVAKVDIQYNFVTRARYDDKESFASFRAVSPEYAVIHNVQVGAKQRFISFLDVKKRNSVIVLGERTVDRLFAKKNPIGKTIYIDAHPFMVIGVAQKKPQMSGADMPDSWLNWIPVSTYELLNNPEKIDVIAVSYRDIDLVKQTKSEIQKIIAVSHGADPNDPGIINFVDIAEKQKKVNKFFINMQIFLGFVGCLTLLLAGVGIANVMYASVKRQTQQIGIQMALGATTIHIVSRYIAESLVATIIGGMIGIIMAITFVYLVRLIPLQSFMLEDFFGKPEPVLSFLVFGVVIVVLGITGFLAGLFPAIKAAKIDPAEALIYE